jgi:CRP-like cAMP-binding protein
MAARLPRAGTVERMLSFKTIPIFSGLSPEDLAAVVGLGRDRFFAKGSTLLRAGEPIPALYAVLDGRVHVAHEGRTMGHATSGGFVGGAAMFARDPRGLGAIAEIDTLAVELESEAFLEILEDYFSVFHHVLRETAGWLLELMRDLPPRLYADVFAAVENPPAAAGDLDLVERILFLRHVSPFAGSISALAELSRGMAETTFPAGTTLWDPGEPSGMVLFVVRGTVSCAANDGATVFAAGPGTVLGAVESVARRPRWHSAVTQTRMTALQSPSEALIDVLEDNFDMAMDYLAMLARAQIRILEMRVPATGKARERLYGCPDQPDEPDLAEQSPGGPGV